MLLSVHLQNWLSGLVLARAPRTIDQYGRLIRLHITPRIGHLEVDQLTPTDILGVLSPLMASGHSRSAQQVYILLKTALRGHQIAVTMADIPRPRHNPLKPAWWAPEAVQRYLAASPGPEQRTAWLLALCCGLRRGELAGLRWSDVDLPAGLIRIRNQRVALSGTLLDGAPKSRAGVRDIPLPSVVAEALASLRLLQQNSVVPVASPKYVLGGVSPYTLNQWHRKQCVAAGVPPIRLHDMRHTMAANAVEAGVDVHVLQVILGHSSVQTTAAIYAHVSHSAKASAVRSVTEHMFGNFKPR